ncbi:hypothetical protein BASA81_012685 [Batrachochytrium salamandrivorans]|nr:hypothetical protein BASA81_012685 [Batrachochytrium salamandrivorans]
MSLSLYHTAAIAAASLSLAAAHGFMAHPGPVSGAFSQHAVRNYDAISTNIDSLRNPIDSSSPICRGAAKGPVTTIDLKNGQSYTITLAFSIGAQHIGPCAVEILDENLSTCSDCPNVIISGGGGGGGGDPSVPPPAPTRTATTTRRNKSTLQPTTDTATSVGESTSTRPPSPSSTTTRKGPKRRKSRKPKTATATTFSPTAEETAVYGTPKGGPKSCGLVAGFAECGKGNANGGPQMACTSDRTGFFACYAGESARAPIRMSCAPVVGRALNPSCDIVPNAGNRWLGSTVKMVLWAVNA